jgi:hypothetical protein
LQLILLLFILSLSYPARFAYGRVRLEAFVQPECRSSREEDDFDVNDLLPDVKSQGHIRRVLDS